jgi:hypothetical protein
VRRSTGPTLLLLLVGLSLLFWLALGGALPGLLGGPGQLEDQQLAGSSYDDGPRGSGDLFRMLDRTRERVERWTLPLTQLPPGGTLVVITPATTMHLEEQRQLLLHAEAGGTVLLVTELLPELLETRGMRLRQVPLPASSRPQVPSALVDPDAPLESRGMALLAPAPGVLSLYGSSHGARVATVATGQGRMVVVTDPFVLSNEGIRRDGNLRFAWRLVHDLPEPVRFDERHHGFEPRRGLLAYARARQLWPTILLACSLVLLTLWRLALSPEPSPPCTSPRPPGAVALVEPLARRLAEARAAPTLRPLLEAEARRRGVRLPSSSTLDPEAWLLAAAQRLSPPPSEP